MFQNYRHACLPEFATGGGQLEEVDGRARQSGGADAEAKAHGDGDACVYGADRSRISGANELHAGSGSTAGREAAFRVESGVSNGVGVADGPKDGIKNVPVSDCLS
jgi:hypothetical protein